MVEKEYACLFVLGKLSQPSLIFLTLARVREWRIFPQLQIEGYIEQAHHGQTCQHICMEHS